MEQWVKGHTWLNFQVPPGVRYIVATKRWQ